jgi:hypothetical protein
MIEFLTRPQFKKGIDFYLKVHDEEFSECIKLFELRKYL